jgi:hypothetical protein
MNNINVILITVHKIIDYLQYSNNHEYYSFEKYPLNIYVNKNVRSYLRDNLYVSLLEFNHIIKIVIDDDYDDASFGFTRKNELIADSNKFFE